MRLRQLSHLDAWPLTNGGSGDGNGAYNACAPRGRSCCDTVYGTYDHYVDALHPAVPSLHLLSE
jgi:hypothetical protein